MSSTNFCDKKTFNLMFSLEKRRAARDWNNSYFTNIRINNIEEKNIDKASKNLKKILSNNLRLGDLICKWEKDNYVVILNNINKRNTDKVLKRIHNNYLNSLKNNSKLTIVSKPF